MTRRATLVLITLVVTAGSVWAGSGALERTRARLKTKTQFSKAMAPSMEQSLNAQAPLQIYSGPTHFQSSAGVTTQIDDGTNNTLIWGIYGPGINIARDGDTGRLTTAWARTPASGPKPRTMFAANSVDAGATWTVVGPLDEQVNSRGYYSAIFQAGSADAGLTDWIVWSERDQKRLDVTHDLVAGLLLFDSPIGIVTATNLPTPDPTLDMVFTFAAAAPKSDGTWNIYVTEYVTAGVDKDNIILARSTDNGQTWDSPKYLFGDNPGQIPKFYQVLVPPALQGNYCALAMAIDPNDANHIGGIFISNNFPDYNPASADTLLHIFGWGNTDYHYFFTESRDAGDTWSAPEMLLGRDPAARRQWPFTVSIDTTGDGTADLTNPAYLYGGAFFWAFLYEPLFTSDGTFHAAIMPTLAEIVPDGGVEIGIGSNYDIPVYARRSPSGQWSYKTDFTGTNVGFDFDAVELDPRMGQAWFAQVSKSEGDVVGISWSSRLPAYTTGPGDNGYPKKGPLVVSASPDGGDSWTEPQAYFLSGGIPEGTAGTTAAENGAWPGSSVSTRLVQDEVDPDIYHFEFVYQALGIDNVTLFPTLQGIWYTNEPSADISTVGVEDRPKQTPVSFGLGQNYPNPFNPSTSIEYALSAASNVKLSIYNALGQEVAVLVNGKVPAGQHTAVWNAQNAPSGLYFYKLEAGGLNQTRKMVLMR